VFNQPEDSHRVCMSPQLTLATFQYLQTSEYPRRGWGCSACDNYSPCWHLHV